MISKKVEEKMKAASWIRAMFEEGNRLKKIHGEENVFDFTLGNPITPPPDCIKDVLTNLSQTADPSLHKYMNNAGFEDVRLAIAKKLNSDTNLSLNQKHVIMTVGAAGALNVILKTILNEGEEVLVLAPYFVEYLFYIDNHGGIPVIVKTKPGTFQLDLEKIEQNITKNTRAIIINSPNNPSGAMYSEDSLKELSNILEKKSKENQNPIYVISDEPYRELVYDGQKAPNMLNIFNNLLVTYSYSKSLSLAGERIGYIAVKTDPEIEDKLIAGLTFANRTLGFVNAPSLFQKVIKELLNETVDVSAYQKRRDFLAENLKNLGYNFSKSAGTFFFFIESLYKDDIEFVKKAAEYRILLVPGTGFGYPGYCRLSYSVNMETIENSIGQFEKLMKKSRK